MDQIKKDIKIRPNLRLYGIERGEMERNTERSQVVGEYWMFQCKFDPYLRKRLRNDDIDDEAWSVISVPNQRYRPD